MKNLYEHPWLYIGGLALLLIPYTLFIITAIPAISGYNMMSVFASFAALMIGGLLILAVYDMAWSIVVWIVSKIKNIFPLGKGKIDVR